MYPLAILLGFAFFNGDRNLAIYSLPFAGLGTLIALYHNLLYAGVISEKLSPCNKEAVSCLEHQLNLLGFISIPLLSFVGFVIVLACLLGILKNPRMVP